MAYSQSDEERVIVSALENADIKQGRFLDIGAYDGKAFSNTLRLVELGWGGVCIEPSPSVFPALLKLHAENPNIELVNAAVSAGGPGLIPFFDSGGDAISSTSVEHVRKWTQGYSVNYKKFFVYTLPLEVLFSHFGHAFEFINLDVESTNMEIFQALPFQKLTKTRLICVEYDHQASQMLSIASAFGFRQIHLNGENLILAR